MAYNTSWFCKRTAPKSIATEFSFCANWRFFSFSAVKCDIFAILIILPEAPGNLASTRLVVAAVGAVRRAVLEHYWTCTMYRRRLLPFWKLPPPAHLGTKSYWPFGPLTPAQTPNELRNLTLPHFLYGSKGLTSACTQKRLSLSTLWFRECKSLCRVGCQPLHCPNKSARRSAA